MASSTAVGLVVVGAAVEVTGTGAAADAAVLGTAVVVRGAAVMGTAYGVRGGAGTEGLGTAVVTGAEVVGTVGVAAAVVEAACKDHR